MVATSNKENVLPSDFPAVGRSAARFSCSRWRKHGSGLRMRGAGSFMALVLPCGLPYLLGSSSLPVVDSDFGSIEQLGTSYSLTGWGFSGLLRYNF